MDMSNRTVFNNLYRSTDEFIRYLSSLKLTEAEAQKSDDRSNIESVIKSTIGYDAVHRQVFTALVEVFTKELLLITPENQLDFESLSIRLLPKNKTLERRRINYRCKHILFISPILKSRI
jgi:hypothetical protein